ncbi:ABC transporter substrate-binding protein [Cellulomonas wangsupingiae]|uniref:Extracellular solute-binding protein n=1 Tax=Cellulomonas wangsupingiae TaxID=2968085 RepID=A0ABY5K1R6_9CELL|nr:extracellular solute-binding protein [Cellulomonas wangsupingiae]MCC2335725.1 extracellular solute-binding protein [Cellulomonas wangsupingiae]MCM0641102.1 extracellular solute-binding protein [Cellulomonas wangsupingiae]UUI63960.1 extracellular solute-binding protein [Cellulomonas wangsupingiae]
MRKTTRKAWALAAGVMSISLLGTACSDGGSSAEGGTDGDEAITLTIATFNDFGYTEELLAEYTELNPNVKVEQTRAAQSADARTNLTTKLAAGGAGLADIEAIEVDWLPELVASADAFADLSDDAVEGRWDEWKVAAATAEDGRLIGYGTDIGPEGICYRADLFEAAGLPTDRAAVAELLGGENATWDSYFEVGRQFVAATPDVAWFETAGSIYQGMVNQLENAYEESDGTAKPLAENTDVKDAYLATVTASADLSANLAQWSGDWDAAFQNNSFATMLCPAWMTGPIEERAGGVTGWDVADVFPGGGGNWGGSYLTVPASGKNVDEAKALAEWLTSPETQVKAFLNAGTFPSQVEAWESADLTGATNDFFNDAPVGEIFANRAAAIDVTPFKGENYFEIHQVVSDAINRVDIEKSETPEQGWDSAVQAFSNLDL